MIKQDFPTIQDKKELFRNLKEDSDSPTPEFRQPKPLKNPKKNSGKQKDCLQNL
jgi:hypothetical protein